MSGAIGSLQLYTVRSKAQDINYKSEIYSAEKKLTIYINLASPKFRQQTLLQIWNVVEQ